MRNGLIARLLSFNSVGNIRPGKREFDRHSGTGRG